MRLILLLLLFISFNLAQVKVACIGDSYTEGEGFPAETTYPYLLDVYLGFGYTVQNFGYGGSYVTSGVTDKDYYLSEQHQSSKNWNPDIVVSMLGSNDVANFWESEKSRFIEEYSKILDFYKSNTKFYIVFPPPNLHRPGYNDKLQEAIRMMRDIAVTYNAVTINVFSGIDWNDAMYIGDHVHPNELGMDIMAKYIAHYVKLNSPVFVPSAIPPSNFYGYYDSDSNKIFLSWEPVEYANHYTIYRGVNDYYAPIYLELSGEESSATDSLVSPNNSYFYAISSLVWGQRSERSPLIFVDTGILSTINDSDKQNPHTFNLFENFPNPFNPNTTIYYSLPNESVVTITVYNMLGKEINQLISQKQSSGTHSIQWNGANHDGNKASAGIYFYQLQAGDFIQTRKMVLLK